MSAPRRSRGIQPLPDSFDNTSASVDTVPQNSASSEAISVHDFESTELTQSSRISFDTAAISVLITSVYHFRPHFAKHGGKNEKWLSVANAIMSSSGGEITPAAARSAWDRLSYKSKLPRGLDNETAELFRVYSEELKSITTGKKQARSERIETQAAIQEDGDMIREAAMRRLSSSSSSDITPRRAKRARVDKSEAIGISTSLSRLTDFIESDSALTRQQMIDVRDVDLMLQERQIGLQEQILEFNRETARQEREAAREEREAAREAARMEREANREFQERLLRMQTEMFNSFIRKELDPHPN